MNTYNKAPEEALACFGAFVLSGQHDISPEGVLLHIPIMAHLLSKMYPLRVRF